MAVLLEGLDIKISASPVCRSPLDVLSPSERKVADAVARGLTNKEIASALGMADQTVKNHLTSAFKKAHVSNRVQLVLLVLKRGEAA